MHKQTWFNHIKTGAQLTVPNNKSEVTQKECKMLKCIGGCSYKLILHVSSFHISVTASL